MRLKYLQLISILIFSGIINISAQETKWDIPKESNDKTAPFLFNDSTHTAGEVVFNANCKSCHGDPGKANFTKLEPIPRDPASPEYQNHSDGALFFIVSTGRGLMPSFQNTLTDNQRWNVISFVRTFNKNYVQPAIKLDNATEIASTIKMLLSYDEKLKSVVATIHDFASGKNIPVSNVPVKLFVKRTFGNLPVGQGNTNSSGQAIITFPEKIPGDTSGNLKIIAIAGTGSNRIVVEKIEKIGTVVIAPNLLDQRAWWNVRSKAHIWLVISYICGGIAVGCVVVYVFLQLKKIKDINQIKDSSHETTE